MMTRPTLAAAATLSLLGASHAAHAFCGFFVSGADANLYNNASQVVLMRKGSHTAMTMSNNYKGPPSDFAMVVPVPVVLKKEQVKTLRPEVFKAVDTLSAPDRTEWTVVASDRCIWSSSASRRPNSSFERESMRTLRSPAATRPAASTAAFNGRVIERISR